MPLFSLISLMIGLFGGSYTAISALKNLFDPYVRRVGDDADLRMEELKQLDLPKTLATGKRTRSLIWSVRKLWMLCYSIPIVGFSIFIFSLAFWASRHWPMLTDKDSPVLPASKIIFTAAVTN